MSDELVNMGRWKVALGCHLLQERQRGTVPGAKILYEKEVIDGQNGRVIRGFEGILERAALPADYVAGKLAFWKCAGGTVIVWPDRAEPAIPITSPILLLSGAWVREDTYQAILTWLRRAGSRLAKIRRQEREAWQGKGADVI